MTDQSNAVADLSALIPGDAAILHVVAPGTNKRTGWQITFAGPGHPKTIAQTNELSRKSLHKAALIEQAQVNGRKWKADDKETADQVRENVAWIVGRIVDWTPVKISQFSPDPIVFSETIAIDLLAQPYMGPFFAQCVEFLTNEASFIAASATN